MINADVAAPSFFLCCVKIEPWCPVLPGRVIPEDVVEKVKAKTKECQDCMRVVCICYEQNIYNLCNLFLALAHTLNLRKTFFIVL